MDYSFSLGMKPSKRTTIYDIAKALNITPATVSRALNGNKLISDATKQQVAIMAKKLNYKHNAHASNLRTGGSKTIGVVVPQITINFFSKAIAGIEEVASLNGYTIIICQSDDDFEKEKAAVETLINQNVACIMISLAAGTKSTEHLQEAINNNVRVIQFDRTDESLPTDRVINEIDNVVAEMVQHLFDQGYRNIAYLAGPQNIDIFRKRREAFERNIKKLGFPLVKKNIEHYDLDRDSSRMAARKLLTQKKRPDAIFASSDLGALGAWEMARELGIQIPEELAICGFSNEFYTEIVSPSITTVNQFSQKMGQVAGNILFDSINNKLPNSEKPVTVIVKPELIVRESTCRKV
jgi:LacI family repressor for deo operon, udp, cdd, tsx, nupC, and nupG